MCEVSEGKEREASSTRLSPQLGILGLLEVSCVWGYLLPSGLGGALEHCVASEDWSPYPVVSIINVTK